MLELARRSCWDNVVRGRFKYLRVSVREGPAVAEVADVLLKMKDGKLIH